jgi:hypothetical protein
MMTRKVLWLVDGDPDTFLKHAKYIGASAVAIRTSNAWLKDSIGKFHGANMAVYGWRWPNVQESASQLYAPNQADFVANTLIPAGLDGYIVDAESDGPGSPANDWANGGVTALAANFCGAIRKAGKAHSDKFIFGTTSGRAYPKSFPTIPWTTFIGASDALYPQYYWQGDGGAEGGGTPLSAFTSGQKIWEKVNPGNKPVIPVIGQIAKVTAADIAAYKKILTDNNLGEVHFYSDTDGVPQANYDAMQAL